MSDESFVKSEFPDARCTSQGVTKMEIAEGVKCAIVTDSSTKHWVLGVGSNADEAWSDAADYVRECRK